MKLRILLFLTLIALISCSTMKDNFINKIVVILIDLTESTNRKEIRVNYSKAFHTILGRINHGDMIVAGLITEKSIAELSIPFHEGMPKFKPKFDTKIYMDAEEKWENEELKKKKNRLQLIVDSILLDNQRKILKTDIMSSLQVAEKIFGNYSHLRKILVVISDMLEDSLEYNFEKMDLTKERMESILTKEKKRDRMPNLGGVKVYVVGAAAPTLDQYYNVQGFWLRYFKESNAVLLKKDYGSALLVFNE